jgi:penicillin-binding protein 1A
MPRLSRAARIARWTLPLSIALFLIIEAFCIHIFILDRRIARELGDRAWLEPTIIVSNAGTRREVARLYGADWRSTPPVKLESLPRHVGDAFLAAEDVRFRRHFGVDPIGVLRAATKNVRAGGITAGGSTIGQQMIKQRFLSADRTWRRKITEMVLAIVLDVRFTKDEILEL